MMNRKRRTTHLATISEYISFNAVRDYNLTITFPKQEILIKSCYNVIDLLSHPRHWN